MLMIYGIPNCSSVKKALDFFRSHEKEFVFVDFKKTKPNKEQIEFWAKNVGIDKLFNNKGTKFRSLGLDFKSLSEVEKLELLLNEPTIIKRPLVQNEAHVTVGFDEAVLQRF